MCVFVCAEREGKGEVCRSAETIQGATQEMGRVRLLKREHSMWIRMFCNLVLL